MHKASTPLRLLLVLGFVVNLLATWLVMRQPPVTRSVLLLVVAIGALLFLGGLILALTAPSSTAVVVADNSTTDNSLDDETPLALLDTAAARIKWQNAAFAGLFGFDAHATTPLSQLWHPDDWNTDRAMFNGQRHRVERRMFGSDGRLRWCDIVLTPRPDGVLLRCEDITQRKAMEAELDLSRRSMRDLYGLIAGAEADLHARLSALLGLGCRRFAVETGYVGQVKDDRLQVLQVVSADERIRRGQVYDLGSKTAEDPLRHPTGPRGLLHAEFTDLNEVPFYTTTDNETYLGAPIVVDGEVWGMLNFSDPEPRPAFDTADTEFLQLMVQWLASEIERRQARAQLEKQQKQLLEVNQKLESMAIHDGLTGLKNRRAFDEHLELEYLRSRRYSIPMSLILMDVDHFKKFNDSFGHPAGDEVLRRVARILQANVRNIDFVSRYGGEEFVLLLPNTDADGADILAERLRSKIAEAKWEHRDVTASIGVATLNATINTASALTSAADGALYKSKENGRNRVTHAVL